MSPRMKALKKFSLRGNPINPGDVFAAKPKDVLMLTVGKLAETTDETETQKAGVSALSSKDLAPTKSAAARQAKPKAQTGEKNLTALSIAELRAHAKDIGVRESATLTRSVLIGRIKNRYNRRDMRAGK